MDTFSDLYLLNGIEVSSKDISQKLFSSALYYGTGCFETMRYENGHICRFDDHIKRLYKGLAYLQLPTRLIPDNKFLKQNITHLLKESGFDDRIAKVRVQCSLIENNGYYLDSDVELLTHIRVNKINGIDKPVRLLTADTRVIPSVCRPSDLKLSNMLHYRSAFREAVMHDYDDALMLTIDEYVAETAVANLFWVRENRVNTPSKECSILPGIMRETTMQALKRSGKLNLEEGTYRKESILNADLVWISNSIVEIRPVTSIDDVQLNCNEHLFKEISSTIHEFKSEKF